MAQKTRGRPKAFHDKTDQNTVQALDRGMEVLSHVAAHPGRQLADQSAAEVDAYLAALGRKPEV